MSTGVSLRKLQCPFDLVAAFLDATRFVERPPEGVVDEAQVEIHPTLPSRFLFGPIEHGLYDAPSEFGRLLGVRRAVGHQDKGIVR